jgi:hypothetical protein
MDKMFQFIGVASVCLLLLFLASTIGGTVVYLTWDSLVVAIPALKAYVASDLSWWTSVKLSFLLGALVKASQINFKKD